MAFVALSGQFYEFHRGRITARPGAVIHMRVGIEIGPMISREEALRRIKGGNAPHGKPGKDVYTLRRQDALRLARDAYRVPPEEEIHEPGEHDPNPSGRPDVYFPHFHPGGRYDPRGAIKKPGHVFYRKRGEIPPRYEQDSE